jgi:hypothetical protein
MSIAEIRAFLVPFVAIQRRSENAALVATAQQDPPKYALKTDSSETYIEIDCRFLEVRDSLDTAYEDRNLLAD